jgi:hypothetical protein
MTEVGALTREPVLQVLLLSDNNLDQQVFMGQTAFAGGGRVPARKGEYVPLDLPTLAAPPALAADGRLTLAIASAAVRDNDAMFRRLIEDVEDAGTWADPPHLDAQIFFIVVRTDKGLTLVEGGRMDDCLARLAGRVTLPEMGGFGKVSIELLLSAVRVNAAKAGITLPSRFTMPRTDPRYSEWIASLKERRRLADARWKLIKARRSKRA